MKSQLQITNANLKNILALYHGDTPLSNVMLGDTCHPQSGYISEQFITDINTVSALLAVEYDFPCLVEFSGTIGETSVKLQDGANGQDIYVITGTSKDISTIRDTIIEKNAGGQKLYSYEVIW